MACHRLRGPHPTTPCQTLPIAHRQRGAGAPGDIPQLGCDRCQPPLPRGHPGDTPGDTPVPIQPWPCSRHPHWPCLAGVPAPAGCIRLCCGGTVSTRPAVTVSWPAVRYWVPSAIQQCYTGHPVLSSCAILGAQSIPSPIRPCHTRCPVPSSHAILGAQSHPAIPYQICSPVWPCHTGHLVPSGRAILGAQLGTAMPGVPMPHPTVPRAHAVSASWLVPSQP